MRQIDDDPTSDDWNEGTIWIKAGDQSDGHTRTVRSEEAEDFIDVRSEAIAVYGGDRWLTEKEAEQLAIRRSKEENLMESIDAD